MGFCRYVLDTNLPCSLGQTYTPALLIASAITLYVLDIYQVPFLVLKIVFYTICSSLLFKHALRKDISIFLFGGLLSYYYAPSFPSLDYVNFVLLMFFVTFATICSIAAYYTEWHKKYSILGRASFSLNFLGECLYVFRHRRLLNGDANFIKFKLFTDSYNTTLDLIENVCLLMIDLWRCKRDPIAASIAITHFVKHKTKNSLVYSLATSRYIDYFLELFHTSEKEAIKSNFDDMSDDDMKLHTQAFSLDGLKNPFNLESAKRTIRTGEELEENWEFIRQSQAWKKMYKFGMFCLSASLFDSFGLDFDYFKYSKVEAAFLRKKFPANSPDMFQCFLSTSIFIAGKGIQIYETGKFGKLFHNSNSYSEWNQRVIDAELAFLLINTDKQEVSETELLRRITILLEEGNEMRSYCNKRNLDTGPLEKRLFKIEEIYSTMNCKARALKARPVPFSFLLYGSPGIGKSSICDLIFANMGKVLGESFDEGSRYTRNPTADFWDGLTSYQWFLQLDDIASMRPSNGVMEKTMETILQVINMAPFCGNQADLRDKGKIACNFRVVCGTTNTKHLNTHASHAVPSAALRRFPYVITMKPKPQFTVDSQLKVPPEHVCVSGYPNYWDFTIEEVVLNAKDTKKVSYRHIFGVPQEEPKPTASLLGSRIGGPPQDHSGTTAEFLDFMTDLLIKHEKVNHRLSEFRKSAREVSICDMCKHVTCDCQALVTQSGIGTKVCLTYYVLLTLWYFNYADHIMPYALAIKHKFQVMGSRFFSDGPTAEMATADVAAIVELSYSYQLQRFLINCGKTFTECYARACGKTPSEFVQEEYYRALGCSVEDTFSAIKERRKFIVAATAIVSASYCFWRYRRVSLGVQGGVGSVPRKDNEPPQNVYFDGNNAFNIVEVSQRSKTTPPVSFTKLVLANSYTCRSGNRKFKMFGVGGSHFIINNHSLPEDATSISVKSSYGMLGLGSLRTFEIDSTNIYRDVGKDLAMLYLPNMDPRRSLIDYFPTESNYAIKSRGALCVNIDGIASAWDTPNISPSNPSVRHGETELRLKGYLCKLNRVPVSGTCGSALIATGPHSHILGIHAGGRQIPMEEGAYHEGAVSFSTFVSREWLKDAIGKCNGMTVPLEAQCLSKPNYPVAVKDLHPKSIFRYMESGEVQIYGSFTGFRPTTKSKVVAHPCREDLIESGIPLKTYAPPMHRWKPWRIAALDMCRPVQIPPSDLAVCVQDVFETFMHNVNPIEWQHLEVYDTMTTINGANGVAYIDPVKKATSAGFPYRTSKSKFVEYVSPTPDVIQPFVFTPEIMEDFHELCTVYERGNAAGIVFTAHLKDEPVTQSKVDSGKVRVFAGAPLAYTLAVRKYLLSCVRVIQRQPLAFETAVGVAAQSKEWGQIRSHLTEFGENSIIAGDYSAFDKRMSSGVILGAFEVLYKLCEKAGYAPEHLRAIKAIATDTAFPTMDFNGDFVRFFGSNPSGHPLTVIINSIANSIYMRLAYRKLNPTGKVATFRKNVNLVTYGDDNVAGVKVPWFNHMAVSRVLGAYGIKYTLADKSDDERMFEHIEDVSFLKRKFMFNHAVGDYTAPLEEDSIHKSLMTWIPSKEVSADVQAAATIYSASREWFFHGQDVFMAKRKFLQELIDKHHLGPFLPGAVGLGDGALPTFAELIKAFKEAGRESLHNAVENSSV